MRKYVPVGRATHATSVALFIVADVSQIATLRLSVVFMSDTTFPSCVDAIFIFYE